MAGAFALLLLVAGCDGPDPQAATTVSPPGADPPTTAVERPALVAGCTGEGAFAEDGTVFSADAQGPSDVILGSVRWEAGEACERFVLDFETPEGAPATSPPAVTMTFLDDHPILRIGLGTPAAVLTDQAVETALVERLYVVEGADGIFVDLHLAGPAQARAGLSQAPASLEVLLQPGIVDRPGSVMRSGSMVLLSPGDEVEAPFRVEGYAIAGAGVEIIATRGGEVMARSELLERADSAGWREFVARVTVEPGPLSVFVGSEGGEGLDGLTLNLTVR